MTEQKEKIIAINPPPRDRKCECCGRHVSELKPFGGAGDPLVGDFSGAYLVKMFRAMQGRIPEYDKIIDELTEQCRAVDSFDEFENMLIERVGKEKAEQLLFYDQLVSTVEASWECRDCIVLDGDDFYMKRAENRK